MTSVSAWLLIGAAVVNTFRDGDAIHSYGLGLLGFALFILNELWRIRDDLKTRKDETP